MTAKFVSLGATLTELWVKDRGGNPRDVVLGYDDNVSETKLLRPDLHWPFISVETPDRSGPPVIQSHHRTVSGLYLYCGLVLNGTAQLCQPYACILNGWRHQLTPIQASRMAPSPSPSRRTPSRMDLMYTKFLRTVRTRPLFTALFS